MSGRSLGEGNGNPLQYSCLENAWTEEAGGLQSMGWQRVGQDRVTNTFTVLVLNRYQQQKYKFETKIFFFFLILSSEGSQFLLEGSENSKMASVDQNPFYSFQCRVTCL